jgi:hypothetical protein
MAKKQPHSSLMNTDEQTFGGFPQDGDEYNEEHEEHTEEHTLQTSEDDRLAQMQRQIEDLKRANDQLRGMIPPTNPNPPAPAQVEEEPNWEETFFSDPNGTLRAFGERVAKQVEDRLTRKYQQEQGTNRFWSEFKEKHPDLADDTDLVSATLNANFASIANMPVDEAIDRLADLTRQRILRYSKNSNGGTKSRKAVAEGENPPQPRPTAPAQTNVTTLSDLIRARRARHRGGGQAA